MGTMGSGSQGWVPVSSHPTVNQKTSRQALRSITGWYRRMKVRGLIGSFTSVVINSKDNWLSLDHSKKNSCFYTLMYSKTRVFMLLDSKLESGSLMTRQDRERKKKVSRMQKEPSPLGECILWLLLFFLSSGEKDTNAVKAKRLLIILREK